MFDGYTLEEYEKFMKWFKGNRKMRKFFRTGYYISVAVWAITVLVTMIFDIPSEYKVIGIVITLVIQIFFLIGKSVAESKYK